jgi:hypothetical protein
MPRALRRSSRRLWQADVHWRAAGELRHATVTLDRLPQAFGVFEHPDVAEGQRMQIAALSIDERQRHVRLDLADGSQRRATAKR